MARMSLWNSKQRQSDKRPLRRGRLAAIFEFFDGGLELGNHEFAVFWGVGNGDLPILDGVGFVAEGGVTAS